LTRRLLVDGEPEKADSGRFQKDPVNQFSFGIVRLELIADREDFLLSEFCRHVFDQFPFF
jgi:hypothetical protein